MCICHVSSMRICHVNYVHVSETGGSGLQRRHTRANKCNISLCMKEASVNSGADGMAPPSPEALFPSDAWAQPGTSFGHRVFANVPKRR